LFVQRIEELLAGGCTGKSSAPVFGAAECPEIEVSLGSAVEHHSHAIHQLYDGRRGMAHIADRCLIGEEIPPVYGVIKVLVWRIPFAGRLDATIDAALGTD